MTAALATGRWTVVARAAPMQRRPSMPALRARVHVQCVCGVERIIWLEDLESGRSRGCESRRCAARFLASQDVRVMLDSWVAKDRAAMLRAMAEAVDHVTRARTRLIDEAIRDYLRPGAQVDELDIARTCTAFGERA